MRFYNRQHQYYCGIDLHVKTMYVCIGRAATDFLARMTSSTRERIGPDALSVLGG